MGDTKEKKDLIHKIKRHFKDTESYAYSVKMSVEDFFDKDTVAGYQNYLLSEALKILQEERS